MMGMVGSMLLLIPLGGLLYAAFEAACLKRMIRGSAGKGLFGINFGADAWRVFGCYLCWFMVLIGAYIGVLLIVGIAAMAGATAKSDAVTALAMLVSVVVAGALWLYVSVRLAPGAAVSIQRGKFSFFDAWGATRGRFWTLFGSFAFLWVVYIVVFIVLEGVAFFLLLRPLVAAMPASGAGASATPEQMQAVWKSLATPMNLAALGGFYLVVLILVLVFSIAGFGINARAALAAAEDAPAA